MLRRSYMAACVFEPRGVFHQEGSCSDEAAQHRRM